MNILQTAIRNVCKWTVVDIYYFTCIYIDKVRKTLPHHRLHRSLDGLQMYATFITSYCWVNNSLKEGLWWEVETLSHLQTAFSLSWSWGLSWSSILGLDGHYLSLGLALTAFDRAHITSHLQTPLIMSHSCIASDILALVLAYIKTLNS